MKPAVTPHEARRVATARRAFVELRGIQDARRRKAAIEALPAVEWKGNTLHTLRCHGERGKGSHDTNVPESLLWSLIGLTRFRCPYHV